MGAQYTGEKIHFSSYICQILLAGTLSGASLCINIRTERAPENLSINGRNLSNIEDPSYTHGSCKLFEGNSPLQHNCHCKSKVADVYNAALIGLSVALFLQSERQLKEARQELTHLVSNIIRIANAVAKHLLF